MINRLVAKFLTSEKNLFRRINLWAKGPLLARLLGDPLNGLNDPQIEKKLSGTLQFNTTQLSPFCFWVTRTTGNPVYAHRASS